MSKIGKKYNLSSLRMRTTDSLKEFYAATNAPNRNGNAIAKISKYEENYNNDLNLYEGRIEFDGSVIHLRHLEEQFNQLLVGKRATDVKFSVDTHYDEYQEKKDKNTSDAVNILKSKTLFEYNFLIKNYEKFLNSNPSINETALPYFFDVLTQFVLADNYSGFDGTNFFENPKDIITTTQRDEYKTNIIPPNVTVQDKSIQIDKYLEKFNVYKEQFPFFTEISFDTHDLDEKSIIQAINKKDLFNTLFYRLLLNKTNTKLVIEANEIIDQEKQAHDKNNPNKKPKKEKPQNLSYLTVWEMDVQNVLNSILDSVAETDFTFIFDLNQRIDSKARTFLEVIEGKNEYSEVIAYHLKKYETNGLRPVQEWFLPNVGSEKFNWIDSQIKYDKSYTYKLDLVVLTFATEYEITGLELRNNKLVMTFVNRPLVKTYVLRGAEENPKITLGSTYVNKLLDYPPLEPEVELVPYIGVDNKIKVNLNTAIGNKTVLEVNFDASEKVKKNELRKAQNKDPLSNLLTFQTDEPSDVMEIYRTETKPKSYEDFFNKKIASLLTNNSPGASLIDSIQPNKKYYYTARAIDFHNNISNPTPIYEIEIVSDNGLVIPIISLVEFDKQEDAKQLSKTFKKHIKIQPAVLHRLINPEKTTGSNIELGSEAITPWNKNFVLRITSKSSGKKIDVKFTFKYNKP